MQPLEHKILTLLKQHRKRPLNRRSLAEHLNLRGQERKQLTRILNQLVGQQLLEERKGHYRVRQQQKLLEGTFSLAERGFGFLRPDDPEREDLFIPARHIGSAMNGDRVQVSCHFSPRQRKRYAQVENPRTGSQPNTRSLPDHRWQGRSLAIKTVFRWAFSGYPYG